MHLFARSRNASHSATSAFRRFFVHARYAPSAASQPTFAAMVAAAPVSALAFLHMNAGSHQPAWSLPRPARCLASAGAPRQLGCLKVDFCGKPEAFTPVYYDAPAAATASVNAGDYKLYVGGGSINLAFQRMLGFDSKHNKYQVLHSALCEAALAAPGCLQRLDDVKHPDASKENATELGLTGSFARMPASHQGDDHVGIAILDVFSARRRPLSDQNVAMLYVVGPKGQGAGYSAGAGPVVSNAKEFLESVKEMASNALLAVSEYNTLAAAVSVEEEKLPQIEVVQFCLVSGGVYKHQEASKIDVAAATVAGLQAAAAVAKKGTVPLVRFAYDAGAFEDAVERVLASNL